MEIGEKGTEKTMLNMLADHAWPDLSLSLSCSVKEQEDNSGKSKEMANTEKEIEDNNIDSIWDSREKQKAKPRAFLLAKEIREGELYYKETQPKIENIEKERTLIYNRPYKKYPSTGLASEKGWLETSFRMGVTRPELYLSKMITKSDTDPHQHRFQLTKAEIANAMVPLQGLARAAEDEPVTVKVLDRKGHKYEMNFKYLASSDTYRFMGAGYTQFLSNNMLKVNQFMDIWGLPIENQEEENWVSFINSDERIDGFED